MGSVDHQLQALEREVCGEGAFAKFDVSPRRIGQAARLPQVRGVHPCGLLLQHGFDLALPCVRQLAALGAEKFDAIVGKRVVAGADDNAQSGALRPREKSHAGRGQGPEQHHIDTRGVEAAFHGALQHIAADARVLANQDRGPLLGLLEHTAYCVRQAQDKVRRDRCHPHRATDAIGSKIRSAHGLSLCCAGWIWFLVL